MRDELFEKARALSGCFTIQNNQVATLTLNSRFHTPPESVDGVKSLHVGPPLASTAQRAQGYEGALHITFDDEQGLKVCPLWKTGLGLGLS